MKGDLGLRIAEWRKLTEGNSLEATEDFLANNSDLLGFLDERGDAKIISRYGNKANFIDELTEKTQKYIQLLIKSIPKNIANLISKNPDFIDLDFNTIIKHYHYLVSRDVPEVAAAVLASTDYLGRGTESSLEEIARDYHITKSSEIPLEIPLFLLRYVKLFREVSEDNHREIGLTFHVVDVLNNRADDEIAA